MYMLWQQLDRQICTRSFVPQASGLKLRINAVDTIILKSGRIAAWFYTSRDGSVCRALPHECNPQTVYQKLVGCAHVDESHNPYGYLALVHYEDGISRPVKQHELQEIVSHRWGGI